VQEASLKSISDMPHFTTVQTVVQILKMLNPKTLRELHKLQLEGGEIFGSIGFTKFPIPSVHVYEPELAEKALRNQGPTPSRGQIKPWLDYRQQREEQMGLLSSEGEEWRKSRLIVAKKIMPPRHVQSFEPAMMVTIDDQIENLTKCADKFAEKDPQGRRVVEHLPNEMYKWAMESIGTVLFETRLGCLDDPMPSHVQTFINSIAEMFFTMIPALFFYDFQKKIGSPYVKRHFAAWDTMFAFVRQVVERRKTELLELAKTTEVNKSQGAVLTYLLLDENLTDTEVIANVTELLLGGVDTTSNTLVWVLYNLARYPEHLRQLEKEVDEVIGPDATPTVKAIHKMPFLKNCVKETLRIYPVTLSTGREIDADMELGGYFLPKKTNVVFNFYNMCMSEKYFEEPHKFDPNRWNRDEGKKFHPFSSVPFGYGPRSCIGKRLAEMEMHLILARIVQKFELRHVTSLPEVTPVMRTLLSPPTDKIIPVEFVRK